MRQSQFNIFQEPRHKVDFSSKYVNDIVMLTTKYWRQIENVGDELRMLVTSFECWFPALM